MRTWSKYQLAVFENVANGTGHTIINAVAGSGKTTVLVESTNHVPVGKRAIFMAFNKEIANTLGSRIKNAEVSTLHSYGLKAITQALGRLRIDGRRVDGFCQAMHGDESKTFDLRRDLVKVVSLAKATLAFSEEEVDALIDRFDIGSASNGARSQFVKDVMKLLEQCTGTEDGCIDFDDMIWLPVVLNLPQRKFDRVFIDECQDLNRSQIELTLRAVKPDGRILAVGDPHQAIYSFRASDEHAFENVKARLDATELPLSISYRCCKSVIREAQTIVPHIEAAPDAEEGEVRSATYKECKRDAQPGDFILSRSNAPLVRLCMSMLREGRKVNIQGRDVGVSLAAFVKKSRAKTVEALRDYVEEWTAKECKRLAEKRRDTQAVEDKKACLLALSEGADSITSVLDRIEDMFADTKDDAQVILLSSTHKAKGLERERVWVLSDTYMRRPDPEERRLYYVAVTRAKKELVLVEGLGRKSEDDE